MHKRPKTEKSTMCLQVTARKHTIEFKKPRGTQDEDEEKGKGSSHVGPGRLY
jgi:hypothetical protein